MGRTSGDDAGAAAAAVVLTGEVPTWAAITAHEVQTPTAEQTTADAVEAGRVDEVAREVAVNCAAADWVDGGRTSGAPTTGSR